MSIEAGGAFSGKLESIDGLKLNNRAEIHINKYYQGIITLYRVSRKIVNMAQEKIEYLVIKLENEEKITAIGLNFKSASGGVRSRNNRTFFALMKKIMDIEIETDDLKLTEFDKAMHSFSDSK